MNNLPKNSLHTAFVATKKCLVENKWLFVFFIPFLAVQLFHIAQQHWDKAAYVFGGKWFCGQQVYFEFIRPPFPSLLNCFFGATDFSIILSTAFACFVYLAGLILIYSRNKKELNQFVFALFAFLFPIILINSNFGSDLLALAFLVFAFGVEKPWKRGVFFALATLSRYNYLIFGIIFIFEMRKKPKKIGVFLIALFLLWFPWVVYNYLFTGNPFFSLAESFFLNVVQKGAVASFSWEQMLAILLFFVLLGINWKGKNFRLALDWAAILGIGMFLISGIKETRFLNFTVPAIAFNAGYFSSKIRKISIAFSFLLSVALVFLLFLAMWVYPKVWYNDISIPNDGFLNQCRVASDKWVFFYEKGIVAECSYDIRDWNYFVQNGGSFVLYDYNNYDLTRFEGKIIDRNEYIIIKSDSCARQPKKYISGPWRNYVFRWLSGTNSKIYDYSDWVE